MLCRSKTGGSKCYTHLTILPYMSLSPVTLILLFSFSFTVGIIIEYLNRSINNFYGINILLRIHLPIQMVERKYVFHHVRSHRILYRLGHIYSQHVLNQFFLPMRNLIAIAFCTLDICTNQNTSLNGLSIKTYL